MTDIPMKARIPAVPDARDAEEFWVEVRDVPANRREALLGELSSNYEDLWGDVRVPDPLHKTEDAIEYVLTERDGPFLLRLDARDYTSRRVVGYDLSLTQTPERLDEMRYPDSVREPVAALMDDHGVSVKHIYHAVLHPDYRYEGSGQQAVWYRQAVLEDSWRDAGTSTSPADPGPDVLMSIVRMEEDGDETPVYHIARKFGFENTGLTFDSRRETWGMMYKHDPSLEIDIPDYFSARPERHI